jgi:hypothetical protein
MPKLLSKYQAKVDDLRKVASALNLAKKKEKVIKVSVKSFFNPKYN